jgi:hypothetical protein
MKHKTRIGDIFTVPISDNKMCYGQVVAACDPIYYMIAFDFVSGQSESAEIQKIVSLPILLLGNFFDTLIKMGEWKVVANTMPNLIRIPFPLHQVQMDGNTFVESWDGAHRRLATPEEARLLDRPANFGPVWLEDALKAHYGLGPDDPEFRKFQLDYVIARTKPI